MNHSPEINELCAALAKAQGEIKGAVKDSDNVFFKSSYADLASVWDACRAALTNNGLSVSQWLSTDGAQVTVETVLAHSSGQWMSGTMSAHAKDDGPQSIGSVATYIRRYSLAAAVGVAPEDDDGNAGQGAPGDRKPVQRPQGKPAPQAEPAKPKPSPEELRKQAVARIRESNSLDDLLNVEQRLKESKTINAVDKTMLQGLIDDQRKYLEGAESAFMGDGPEPDGEGM